MTIDPERFESDEPVNILIVDDHEENLVALRAILDLPEYHLVSATSGPEALKRLLREEFALILLDVMMPNMDGYEVAARIKERESNRYTPIIFLTAVARDIEHIFQGYAVGAVDYLSKPLAAEVVKAKVEVFADLYRQAKKIQQQAKLLAEREKREKEYRLAELKRSEAIRYRNLAESIPQIVWTTKPDGTITYLNQRWYDYTGLTMKESMNSGWLSSIHADDHKRISQSWENALQSGTIFSAEFRLLRGKDMKYHWHLAQAIPSRDLTGTVIEWFGTCTDIEVQKLAELELQETLRSRDEFFSIASHELKTPITSLKLQLQLLSRNAKKNPNVPVPAQTVLERLEVATRQTNRLEQLIENLLDVTRIRSHKLSIERENLDLTALIRDVVSRFSEQLNIAGCTAKITAPEPIEGYFDRVRIEQVVTNLVSNAIKYGAGKPIEVELFSDSQTATLVVKDHGIGISQEDQARIFGRFERAVSSKDFTGLGLGLYITLQIVQAHGGNAEVESTLNQGSTFKIHLPRNVVTPVVRRPSEDEPKWANQLKKKYS